MKARERGSMIVELIIYGILAAVVMGVAWKAWQGFKDSIGIPYAEEQLAKDKPLIDTAKANEKSALASKAQAELDAKAATDASALQTQALAEAEKLTKEAQAAARVQAQKYAAEKAKNAARESALRAAAAATPKNGQTCEALLSATDAILRESARVRQEMQ